MDVAHDHRAFDQGDDLLGHHVEVERYAFSGALAQQLAQALNHLIDAVFVGDDLVENPAHRRQIDRIAGEQSPRRLRMTADARQRLIQLVRQRGRQLVHRRHTRDLRELVAAPLRGVFGAASR